MTRADRPSAGDVMKRRTIRCAIYTRKSTSEGLEQEFNSLDAQREAAESFVASQKSEGWTVLPQRYDDGGFTGANADRPALQQLLEDITDRRIDVVVVYKVDRLSRSLLDFARLIELFEKYGVSLVSVTQSFNTATSMGRLTLNILLSFAQFERELISERTRDKMGAARRKGKWIGGTPPIGYRLPPGGGRLEIDPQEAALVREVYDLYQQRRSIIQVVEELRRRGRKTRQRQTSTGRVLGGKPLSVSNVHSILTNAVYAGKIRYEGELYAGEHEGIISETVFEAVAEIMSTNHWSGNQDDKHKASAEFPLAGLLRCGACDSALTPTRARAGNRHYRYYVCVSFQKNGRQSCPVKRLSAPITEARVVAALRQLAAEPQRLPALLEVESPDLPELLGLLQRTVSIFGSNWDLIFPAEQRRVLRLALSRVMYQPSGELILLLSGEGLMKLAAEVAAGDRSGHLPPPPQLPDILRLHVDAVAAPEQSNEPAPQNGRKGRAATIASVLALAHRIEELVRTGQAKDYAAVARQLGISRARVTQLSQLRFLAPAIQEEVTAGLTERVRKATERQLRGISMLADWNQQMQVWTAAEQSNNLQEKLAQ